MSDRHQGQQGFHHLRSDTINGIEIFHRRERTVLLPPLDDAFCEDGTYFRQGVEFLSRRSIKVKLSSRRGSGSRVPAIRSAHGPASGSGRWLRNGLPCPRNMDLGSVLHYRGKVETVQLGSRLCAPSSGDSIKHPRSGGQRDDPGILHGAGDMDSKLAAPRFGRVFPCIASADAWRCTRKRTADQGFHRWLAGPRLPGEPQQQQKARNGQQDGYSPRRPPAETHGNPRLVPFGAGPGGAEDRAGQVGSIVAMCSRWVQGQQWLRPAPGPEMGAGLC